MDDTSPPLNREQRRAQKFHRKSHGRQDNLQTQRENNSGFLTDLPTPATDEAATDAATASTEVIPVPDEAPTPATADAEPTRAQSE